jgi:hypothetical protein
MGDRAEAEWDVFFKRLKLLISLIYQMVQYSVSSDYELIRTFTVEMVNVKMSRACPGDGWLWC